MRNVFDQYSQPENRVTHALVSALNEDRRLLRRFVVEIVGIPKGVVRGNLEVCEQTFPGSIEPLEADEQSEAQTGIPDAWITSDDGFCVVVENKILGGVTASQIDRHLVTAKRLGFEQPHVLVLKVHDAQDELPEGVLSVDWRTIYLWLLKHAKKSPWAKTVADFLEVMEARLVGKEQLSSGTLTTFSGFGFDENRPFTYLEAKRLLGLATHELRQRNDLRAELGLARDLPGRPAITGRNEGFVWDFLRLEQSRNSARFTKHPHLTIDISQSSVGAMVTVPNDVPRSAIKRLVKDGPESFRQLIKDVLDRMQPHLEICTGMEPRILAIQRRYPSQRSVPFIDAEIDFDLRTAFEDAGPPKTQTQWLDAVYESIADKRSNLQFQIGARFPFRTCPKVRDPSCLDYVAGAWISTKPLLDLISES